MICSQSLQMVETMAGLELWCIWIQNIGLSCQSSASLLNTPQTSTLSECPQILMLSGISFLGGQGRKDFLALACFNSITNWAIYLKAAGYWHYSSSGFVFYSRTLVCASGSECSGNSLLFSRWQGCLVSMHVVTLNASEICLCFWINIFGLKFT